MYATERKGLIERLLIDEGRVAVIDLSERFGVTTGQAKPANETPERSQLGSTC